MNNMMVIGLQIKEVVLVLTNGIMEIYLKETGKMIREMVKELNFGLMEINMKETG